MFRSYQPHKIKKPSINLSTSIGGFWALTRIFRITFYQFVIPKLSFAPSVSLAIISAIH